VLNWRYIAYRDDDVQSPVGDALRVYTACGGMLRSLQLCRDQCSGLQGLPCWAMAKHEHCISGNSWAPGDGAGACGRCVPCISGISNAAGFMWKRERRTSTPGTQSFDRISRPGLLRGNMERQETRGGSTHPVATSRTGMRGLRRVSATLSALGSGALSRNLRHLGPSWRLPPSPWPTFEL
jgi:hypothetical protein